MSPTPPAGSAPPRQAGLRALLLAWALATLPAHAQEPGEPPAEAPGEAEPRPGNGSGAPESSAPPPPSTPAPAQPEVEPEDLDGDGEISPKERRKALRAARWSSDVPPPEADFLRDHTDLLVRIGFGGYTPGPFSLFTAFAGWFDLGMRFDRGVVYWKDFTLGLGLNASYSNPAILSALTQPIANYDDIAFRWRMWEAAGTVRGTLHYHRLQSIDPFLFAGVGAGGFVLRARVKDWPTVPEVGLVQPFVRLEAGGGINTRIEGSNWIVGGELRYVVSITTTRERQLQLQQGDTSATFTLFPQHQPERGFGWGVHVGYRF